jgi:hypothetical protein
MINRAVLVFLMMQLLSTLAFAEKMRVLISTDLAGVIQMIFNPWCTF